MNRDQLSLLTLGILAVVVLGAATAAFSGIVSNPSDGVGTGSTVFYEDVTIEESLNPQSRDISDVPFLSALYDTEPADNESINASEKPNTTEGRASLLPIAMVIVAVITTSLVVFAAWFWRLRRESGSGAPTTIGAYRTEDGSESPVSHNGIEQLDIDDLSNDVYRAWFRLFERIDPSPDEHPTPRELARMAIADGFDQDAVKRLTEQFEAVRYGPKGVTSAQERLAREALSELGIEEEIE
jgi:hypothetical protein